MTAYLANAFSLNMLDIGAEGLQVDIQPVLLSEIPADAKSIIGHADMAAILAGVLGRTVGVNRDSVVLNNDDILYVAQYHGARLPAGATELPADAQIEYYRITIQSQ
jgi:hypothetical protein